ncbi:MAG: DUF402 domain-containing protein [Gemmatimonadota bacterium]|nr:DUF402 domain-containing protein [Gemmatimonadota bacterium]
MSRPGSHVRIHYRRVPDHVEVFEQRVVENDGDCIVTLAPSTPLRRPIHVGERVILEPGSPVVWFTFPGEWHDIGRFHRADGTFTGYYANVLTPPEIDGRTWRTTDLFLDIWLPPDGSVDILDEDEFEEARMHGLLDAPTAHRARDEASRLVEEAGRGQWPPHVVDSWTLPAARARLETLDGSG